MDEFSIAFVSTVKGNSLLFGVAKITNAASGQVRYLVGSNIRRALETLAENPSNETLAAIFEKAVS